MDDILRNGGRLSQEIASEVRRAGVVVVRNVIPRDEAIRWKEQLEGYLHANRDSVLG